ncbi:MAG: Flp pilus assembly complex ATPase component TadA [Candidatus Omnitrophica bacterium]|nr:Flp pilus assembly complex ATPase component TadA [Candidatus Omnitrophota bacterium]
MIRTEDLKLGELLLRQGIISRENLEQALREQKAVGGFIGQLLVRLGMATEEQILPILSKQLEIPYVFVKELEIPSAVIEKVPAKFASHYKLLPIAFEGNVLNLVVTDPFDVQMLDDLRILLGCEVKPVLGGERDISDAIRKYYGVGAGTLEEMMDLEGEENAAVREKTQTPENIADLAEDASVVKFVNQILLQAVQDRATDIHFEPFENDLRIRYRIDGILYDIHFPPTIKNFQSAITSRIKIMANLDIAERRLPQDGRIKIKINDRELDLRVSILPTPFGESVDVRLLSTNILFGLENLGLSKHDQDLLEVVIKKPHGIIFVTGPTGSGKTTTLYACLNKINTTEKKIITIEDPIEYQLRGITQVQIFPKIGLTFANGLRTMLRHDPDVMMVGEVRDFETAEIAIRIALTGHLVFSTLHTNDASGAVTRLLDMGIEPYLVAASVECLIAQRLVRTICPSCRKESLLDEKLLGLLGVVPSGEKVKVYQGEGCEACKFTGYRGRTAIYEMLIIDGEIREKIGSSVNASDIKQVALRKGMRTLRQDGWDKVLQGITTPAEVIRVAQEGV